MACVCRTKSKFGYGTPTPLYVLVRRGQASSKRWPWATIRKKERYYTNSVEFVPLVGTASVAAVLKQTLPPLTRVRPGQDQRLHFLVQSHVVAHGLLPP